MKLLFTRSTCDRELVSSWLNYRKNRQTQISVRYTVENFIDLYDLRSLQLEDLQQWQQNLAADYVAQTIAHKTKLIKSLLSFGRDVGYLNANPGKFLEIPTFPDQLTARILTEAEVYKIIDATEFTRYPLRNRFILLTIFLLGLRISELCNLQWSNLIPKPDKTGATAIIFGKGGKTRHLPIPEEFWVALQQFRGELPYVFVSNRGNKCDRTVLHRMHKTCVERSGIAKDASLHWQRHAHAGVATDNNCDLELLRISLGHSKYETTLRYLHAKANRGSSQYIDILIR